MSESRDMLRALLRRVHEQNEGKKMMSEKEILQEIQAHRKEKRANPAT